MTGRTIRACRPPETATIADRQFDPRPLRVGRVVLCTVFLVLYCAACGGSATHHPGSLRLPLAVEHGHPDPGILDPALETPTTPLTTSSMLFAGLVKFSPDLHVIPELAVSLPTISTDGRSYTFTIRQDAHFADGRPCTARDVIYSLSRALSPRLHAALALQYLGGIVGASAVEAGRAGTLAGATAVHRLTVRIRLTEPDATFMQKLAFPVAAIVEHGTGAGPPHGLGAWTVRAVGRDGSMTLTPRPHYYGGRLQLEEIRLVAIRSSAQATALYRKGTIDAAQVPSAEFAAQRQHTDFHRNDALGGYFAIPPENEPALAAALDRNQLAADAGPMYSPLSSLVPPAVPDYVASPPSVSESATLPPVSVTAEDASDAQERRVVKALKAQWPQGKTAGTTIRVVHVWYALPDPGRWLRIVLSQTRSRWYRSMLTSADGLTNDPVSRMSAYSQAENWALERGMVIPLLSDSIAYLIKPSVQNMQVTPLGVMPENNNWALAGIT